MPHMFSNRRRLHHLTAGRADLRAQFRWETINAVVYKIGGAAFVVGSVLFLAGGVFNYWRAYLVVSAVLSSRRP